MLQNPAPVNLIPVKMVAAATCSTSLTFVSAPTGLKGQRVKVCVKFSSVNFRLSSREFRKARRNFAGSEFLFILAEKPRNFEIFLHYFCTVLYIAGSFSFLLISKKNTNHLK